MVILVNNFQMQLSTMNVDIFALLNFHASSPRRHIRVVIFSRSYQLFLFVLLLLSFLITTNFRASKALREMREKCTARKYLRLQYKEIHSIRLTQA